MFVDMIEPDIEKIPGLESEKGRAFQPVFERRKYSKNR
jgi:hypothetical protein